MNVLQSVALGALVILLAVALVVAGWAAVEAWEHRAP